MSSNSGLRSENTAGEANVGTVDMKLEVITIPVADIDRATAFYGSLGWRRDVTPPASGVVQFTPPGSACSIQFGVNRTSAAPGSAQGQFLIVSDIKTARDDLVGRGVEASDVFHIDVKGRADGPDPDHRSYASLASFSDPDGNRWLLQEVTARLPGRVDLNETTFASAGDLANAMRRASVAHDEHEKRHGGEYDVDWPDWYSKYMVAEQRGAEPPE